MTAGSSFVAHPVDDTAIETFAKLYTANRWGIAHPQLAHGRLVGLVPIAEDPAPSPLLDRLSALPYNPMRIGRPAVRTSFLREGPASRDRRGREGFVEVDWDTALGLVARHLKRVYRDFGPQSVWGASYGWMNTGHVQGARPLLHRLLNLMGGFVRVTGNYSNGAISTVMPYIVGARDPRSTDWESVLESSELVVFWGADPIRTLDVDWFTPLHQGRAKVRQLKERGIRTLSINPRVTDTAKELGSASITPYPGTDVALVMGCLHVLITEGLVNRDFVSRCAVGFDAIERDVLGKVDGVAKTPAWASHVTGIAENTIVDLARDMATHRTMIMMGWGMQRQQYGERAPWALWALAVALGQIGLPGGGIGSNYHYDQGGNAPSLGPQLPAMPTDPKGIVREEWIRGVEPLPVQRWADVFLNPGKTIAFNGKTLTFPDIRLAFWTGGNPFAHHPNTNRVAEAFRQPEVIIVSDINWTATARHADIVLPACTNFEMSDITRIGAYTNDGLVFTEAVIPPQGEARSNFDIFRSLARLLGLEEAFTEGLNPEGWRRRFYEAARQEALLSGYVMPEYDEARAKGLILYPSYQGRPYIAFEAFRADPEGHPLNTPSGKIELFSERIASYHYDDCPPYPTYTAPVEGAGQHEADFPYTLLTPKSERRLHSQLNSSLSARYGHEPCLINPKDASREGIVDGSVVIVESRRGRALLVAQVTDDVREGVMVIHHGAWYTPVYDARGELLDQQGCPNTLTLDVGTSSLAQANVASGASVRVKPYLGDVEAMAPLALPAGVQPAVHRQHA